MPFTVASLTGLTKQTLGLLNASSAYAAITDDDKFTDGLVGESLFQSDERIYTAGAETKGHWMRPEIMDWSAAITTYLAEVPAHIGELGDVEIKYVAADTAYQLGKPMKREEIEIYRRDTDGFLSAAHNATGTIVAGYFDPEALKDGVCAFTGAEMKIRVATYTRTAALQSPQSYSSGIVAFALSYLFSVDGLDPELAKYYSTLAMQCESLVRGNAKVLTELPELRKAA